uniref:Uncharacterized protein n=3 Tax=Enterobacteriaceae TaxID=543 RepID=D0QML8_ECOLX|nr:hypothetical protein pSE34_39 [Salmonella enterica subsp. enterica serovar Enteritidis]ACA51128.1 hypothetical protein pOU1114_046 [Salmonella enterica subsp. enterica serovar Dublin]ACV89881.1 hypothetical protein pMAS2027_14 [Escherichia coli]
MINRLIIRFLHKWSKDTVACSYAACHHGFSSSCQL